MIDAITELAYINSCACNIFLVYMLGGRFHHAESLIGRTPEFWTKSVTAARATLNVWPYKHAHVGTDSIGFAQCLQQSQYRRLEKSYWPEAT